MMNAFTKMFNKMFGNLFSKKEEVKLGFYGPPNAGKTSLANRICKDFTGEELGTVSKIPHETRTVQFKEKVDIEYKGKKMTFKMIDTPGIATKIDYEDFLKYKMNKKDAKERAKIFGQYDHVRVYGRDYFDKLRSIGFRVEEVDYTASISSQLVEKYCLAKGEIIPVCFK